MELGGICKRVHFIGVRLSGICKRVHFIGAKLGGIVSFCISLLWNVQNYQLLHFIGVKLSGICMRLSLCISRCFQSIAILLLLSFKLSLRNNQLAQFHSQQQSRKTKPVLQISLQQSNPIQISQLLFPLQRKALQANESNLYF